MFSILCAVMISGNSQTRHPAEQKADLALKKLYQTPSAKQLTSIDKRLGWVTQLSLKKPYLLFPLGEGLTGAYDQQPRYRLDGFDCGTFVSTQLALALSNSPKSFKRCLALIRYHGNQSGFLNRNHFTSLDWNQSNQNRGLLNDLTTQLKDANHQTLYQSASATIDKSAWFQKTARNRIKLFEMPRSEIKARAHELKNAGKRFKPVEARITFIPTEALLNKQGQLKRDIINQIPDGAIMEVVRPNWNLRDKIGTNLHISHLGFIFWQGDQPYFRHASSHARKVVNVPLQDYLRAMLKSPTIKGINIQVVPFANLVDSPCYEKPKG